MMYLTGYNPLTGRREAISFPMEDDAALRKLAQIKKDGSVYKRVKVRRLEPNQLLLDL
ncbi:MAG: hypothetical protein IKV82_08255 [Akkermansia sp.]|nr:hypothetical protein [Akkermansia sp.]